MTLNARAERLRKAAYAARLLLRYRGGIFFALLELGRQSNRLDLTAENFVLELIR